MKRFWKDAKVARREGGWAVELDSRRLLTSTKSVLAVPTAALAEAIANEWADVGETVDPRAMPLTGLANAAIDVVAADPEAFAGGLARYGESDLLCYRAEAPAVLAEREAAAWEPLLSWARRRFDVDFRVTAGVTHVPQPEATVTRLAHAVAALDPFRLAALSPLVTVGGSLVAALAVAEGAVTADQAWQAVTVDERWQAEQWGADADAQAAMDSRRRDFMAAASFLKLLDL
jgi:chaperone required for assembly of F1-ATPase